MTSLDLSGTGEQTLAQIVNEVVPTRLNQGQLAGAGSNAIFQELCKIVSTTLERHVINSADGADDDIQRVAGEWLLYAYYANYDIRVNPFLGHWLEVWKNQSGTEAQSAIVGLILAGEAADLSTRTPNDFIAHHQEAMNGDLGIPIEEYLLALRAQGSGGATAVPGGGGVRGQSKGVVPPRVISGGTAHSLAPPSDRATEGTVTPHAVPSTPSNAAALDTKPDRASSEGWVVEGMQAVTVEALGAHDMEMLSRACVAHPDLVATHTDLNVATIQGIQYHNPVFLRSRLIPLLVSMEAYRDDLLSTLSFLSPSLSTLETITRTLEIIGSSNVEFLHIFIENATRQIMNSGNKEEMARLAEIMVLFFKNAIRQGLLMLDDFFLDIQQFCMSFMWVVEVANVRHNALKYANCLVLARGIQMKVELEFCSLRLPRLSNHALKLHDTAFTVFTAHFQNSYNFKAVAQVKTLSSRACFQENFLVVLICLSSTPFKQLASDAAPLVFRIYSQNV